MGDNALYVSNGTCFYGEGLVADPHYIPCGNAALMGPVACCYEGDFCLSEAACWDNNTITTYVAGCTDVGFKASVCVNKLDYPNQQYVAIARCNGDDIDIWSGCYKHPQYTAIEKEPDCTCDPSKPLVRARMSQSTLDQVGSLPPTAGGTISYNPTAVPTPSPTYSAGSNSANEPNSGLSSSVKVGVGVGVGVGVPLLGALIFLAYFLRRKKAAIASESTEAPTAPDPEPQDGAARETPKADVTQAMLEKQLSSKTEAAATQEPSTATWYGHKPELEANSTNKHELSGDEPKSVQTSSWNSGTIGSHQVSELSSHDAVTSAEGRSSLE